MMRYLRTWAAVILAKPIVHDITDHAKVLKDKRLGFKAHHANGSLAAQDRYPCIINEKARLVCHDSGKEEVVSNDHSVYRGD